MMAAPDMVGGTFESLDTELMRRRPGRLVAKAGADGLRAVGLLAGPGRRRRVQPAGLAIKIEDGDLSRRAIKAATRGGAGPGGRPRRSRPARAGCLPPSGGPDARRCRSRDRVAPLRAGAAWASWPRPGTRTTRRWRRPADDPYRILGILRGADLDEIKVGPPAPGQALPSRRLDGRRAALPGRAGGLPAALRPAAAPRVGSPARARPGARRSAGWPLGAARER